MNPATERSLNLPYQPQLDHLRFLAAGLVFSFHVFHHLYGHWQAFPQWPWLGFLTEGYTGVALFFALSGFLFTRIAERGAGLAYGPFLRNRFLRIFPLFVCVFFLSVSLGRDKFQPQDILYLFFSNLGQAPTSNSFLTGAAWTISLEFSFYLVFPWLARFAQQYGSGYLLRLILLVLIARSAVYTVAENPVNVFYSTILGRFDQFLCGMLAARFYLRHTDWLARRARWLLPGAVLLVWAVLGVHARYGSYFAGVPQQPWWIFWPTLEASVWSLLIMVYASGVWPWPRFLLRLWQRGGELSYSFYLLHGLVLYTTYAYLTQWGLAWQPGGATWQLLVYLLFLVVATWGVATLSYETIEKPFLGLRGLYLRPVRSVSDSAED